MQIGIFAKTFARPSLHENADAILMHGFHSVQYNLSCAGIPSLPEHIDPEIIRDIHDAMHTRGISLAAISGTFNMCHPDQKQRAVGLTRLRELALHARKLTSVITLCTGTRDTGDMWRAHPDNRTTDAWYDLLHSMEQALSIAEEADISLAIEPEIANVVDSAPKARRLLDEMRSSRLKVVIDPANLFYPQDRPFLYDILEEAFDLLGQDMVIAHAKDVLLGKETVVHCAAGSGELDYEHYLALLRPLDIPLILHGLQEAEVPFSSAYLHSFLTAQKKSREQADGSQS